MNLYFRLILVILRALRRDTITPALLKNSISVRMMPNDLDINLQVNKTIPSHAFCSITMFNILRLSIKKT
jgi:hypothetical protein